MQAIKFIFVISLICISTAKSLHNIDDYLRLSLGKEVDSSSEENLKKLKNFKEFNYFEHSIQEHKLKKSENRRDYIRYYAQNPPESDNLSDESSSSDSSENSEDNFQLYKHNRNNRESNSGKGNPKSTSSSESYFKEDTSEESNKNSYEHSAEIERDSDESDDSVFHHSSRNSESKSQSNKNKNRNNHKNNKNKYDSIDTIENISKDKDSESDESYRHVLKDIRNNIKSHNRKISENKSASVTSYKNIKIDDSSENIKSTRSSEADSNSVEHDKTRTTKEIDPQDDNLNDIINSNEFENKKQSRESSRNYDLGPVYHDFRKISVQQENTKIQNLLNELNRILNSKRRINAKSVHDNEINKLLKESIINKWREMNIAVRLILIDNYRSIKNNLLAEVKNNPQATNRDISRLERKLLFLFHMSRKDIVNTVQLTRYKFRIETAKLNLSQLQIYETEQLYLSKLREQIDAKIAALKKNVAFDIEQFHQAIKPVGDYTTPIITVQTSTEVPFDPVFEITTTQANIVTNKPSTNASNFGHVDIDNLTPGTLIEVDDTLNSSTTDTDVGSHKLLGIGQKENNSQQRERSSKSLNNITKNTKYTFITSAESPTVTTKDLSDQGTVHTITVPISGNPSIGTLSTIQALQNLEVTPLVSSSNKQNNASTNTQPDEKTSESNETITSSVIETTSSSTPITVQSTTTNTEHTNSVIISNPVELSSAAATTGPSISKNSSTNASFTTRTLPNSKVTTASKATKQSNVTVSNSPVENSSESTIGITSLVTETSTISKPVIIPSTTIAITEQTDLITSNKLSNQRTSEASTNLTINENLSTDALPTTKYSPNSEVTLSAPNTTKQNNEETSESTIETTAPLNDTSPNSTPIFLPSTVIANTDRTHLITSNKQSDQRTSETTSDSTINENPSTDALPITKTPPNSEVTPSVIDIINQNNVTVSNQPAAKTSEPTTEISSPVTETSASSTPTRLPPTIGTSSQAHLLTSSDPPETTSGPSIMGGPSTDASFTTQTPLNSEVTVSIISSTKQNTTIMNQPDERTSESNIETTSPVAETSTNSTPTSFSSITTNTEQVRKATVNPSISENSSTEAAYTTQTPTNSEVIPSVTTSTKQNVTIDNQPIETTSETTIESTSHVTETSTNSTFTGLLSTTTINTEQTNSETTSNLSNPRITETTTGLSTSEVTPSVTSSTKQNVIISNQPDETTSKTTKESKPLVTETSASSTPTSLLSTTIKQTNSITTSNSSDPLAMETTTVPSINENPSTETASTTQTPINSEATSSSKIIIESTSPVTETSTSSEPTILPSTTIINTEQTNTVTMSNSTKPSTTVTELSTESTINNLENTSQNIYECVDNSGSVINCESIINSSTTTATNLDVPIDQRSQTWPGVPQECLSLFLAPDGEILPSVSTENHKISDPQKLDLCLLIAKTIVQLNHPDNNKSVTA